MLKSLKRKKKVPHKQEVISSSCVHVLFYIFANYFRFMEQSAALIFTEYVSLKILNITPKVSFNGHRRCNYE